MVSKEENEDMSSKRKCFSVREREREGGSLGP